MISDQFYTRRVVIAMFAVSCIFLALFCPQWRIELGCYDYYGYGGYGCPDTDGDGIHNVIDTLPDQHSNAFGDGWTFGIICDRGAQELTISDAPNPQGVTITGGSNGGCTPATVSACGRAALLSIGPGDEVEVTCGSVEFSVISGAVEILFFAADGTFPTTTLYEGNSLTFDPETSGATAPPTNLAPTVILLDGVVFSIEPGETVVIDNQPPEIEVNVTPEMLWPPNHKLIRIMATVTVTDNHDPDPNVVLTSITMNEEEKTNTFAPEYDATVGDGETLDDIQVDGDIYLRAERAGTGNGRVYTITYTAIDASGNSASASATVVVPHDQS